MTDVLRPRKVGEQVARSLLDLAAALANHDPEPPRIAVDPPRAAEEQVPARVSVDASMPERLTLTVEEAAQMLGVSRAHAYELAARGEIPTLRLGRRVLVPRGALLRMMST